MHRYVNDIHVNYVMCQSFCWLLGLVTFGDIKCVSINIHWLPVATCIKIKALTLTRHCLEQHLVSAHPFPMCTRLPTLTIPVRYQPHRSSYRGWVSRWNEQVRDAILEHTEQVTHSNKEFADWGRTDTLVYQPWVWLSTKDIPFSLGCHKVNHRYIGLYKLLPRINDFTYLPDLPCHWCLALSFHVSCFKSAIEGPLTSALRSALCNDQFFITEESSLQWTFDFCFLSKLHFLLCTLCYL